MYEIKGKVVAVGKVQTFHSGFSKQDLIVDTALPDSKYPNPVRITFNKNHIDDIKDIGVGSVVNIKFAVNGRKWDGPKGIQYFVDLVGLGVTVESRSTVRDNDDASSTGAEDASADDMPF